jgi:hypothetical protein
MRHPCIYGIELHSCKDALTATRSRPQHLPRRSPDGSEAHFFRTSAGAEIDLLLKLPGHRKPWAIEIKRGLAPKVDKGFHLACDAVRPERRLVVYGGVGRFPLGENVEAVSLADLCDDLSQT